MLMKFILIVLDIDSESWLIFFLFCGLDDRMSYLTTMQ